MCKHGPPYPSFEFKQGWKYQLAMMCSILSRLCYMICHVYCDICIVKDSHDSLRIFNFKLGCLVLLLTAQCFMLIISFGDVFVSVSPAKPYINEQPCLYSVFWHLEALRIHMEKGKQPLFCGVLRELVFGVQCQVRPQGRSRCTSLALRSLHG